jgi:hypothetical protein
MGGTRTSPGRGRAPLAREAPRLQVERARRHLYGARVEIGAVQVVGEDARGDVGARERLAPRARAGSVERHEQVERRAEQVPRAARGVEEGEVLEVGGRGALVARRGGAHERAPGAPSRGLLVGALHGEREAPHAVVEQPLGHEALGEELRLGGDLVGSHRAARTDARVDGLAPRVVEELVDPAEGGVVAQGGLELGRVDDRQERAPRGERGRAPRPAGALGVWREEAGQVDRELGEALV